MSEILKKEMKLSASNLSYIFIAFGLMFFLPGYPVLCGSFFICLGIFQSFQNAREANDTVFSVLLPISKRDVVKGKFEFVCFIEMCGTVVMLISAIIRMTVLSNAKVYRENALMNANFFALGMALVVFGTFNLVFVRGFFKTAYKFTKPFICFIVVDFLITGVAESVHHIPKLAVVNSFGFKNIGIQLAFLAFGIIIYTVMTFTAFNGSCKAFDKIDL